MNINQIKKWWKKNQLDFVYKDRYTLFSVSMFDYSPRSNRDVIGNHHKNYLFISDKGEVSAYYSGQEKKLSANIALKFLNKKFNSNHFESSSKIRKEYSIFVTEYKKIKNHLTKLSKEELINLFEKYLSIYSRLLAYFRSTRPEIADPLVLLIDNELKKNKFNKNIYEKLRYFLITPFINDPIKLEQNGWLNVLKKDFSDNLLKIHAEKYPWLFMNTYSITEAVKYLKFRYLNDKKKIEELKKIIKARKNEEKKSKDFIEEYLNNLRNKKEINYLSDLIIKHASERLLTKCSWTSLDFIFRDLLEIFAKRIGVPIRELMATYTYAEILNFIYKNKKNSAIERQRRKNFYVFISKNLQNEFYSGAYAKKIANAVINLQSIKKIKGAVANNGRAIGRVIIVKSYEANQLKKYIKLLKKGTILVTGMTHPNVVPLLNKISAIITDQGGLTSHAAIVSREFNIPCIVGTKIATQVLHDGDLVEVDADKGVVEIIKKNKK